MYANSNMIAVGSSTHMNEHPSYVLDEMYGNECKTINVYSSEYEKKPMVKSDMDRDNINMENYYLQSFPKSR